jgi:phosphoserine phosphatase
LYCWCPEERRWRSIGSLTLLAQAGAEILETRTVPVPVTLSDRRTVHNLLVNSADAKGLSSRLRDLSDEHGVDIALQPRAARCQSYRLAVFDMDSTLIDCEVIDELAAQAGVGQEVCRDHRPGDARRARF